jgi:NAD+ kinase
MLRYQHIGVTVKSGLSHKHEAVEHIVSILQAAGATVFLDPKRAEVATPVDQVKMYAPLTDQLDLMVVIGGDGTIFRAIREMPDLSVPIISINRGTVGFLCGVELDDAASVLPRLLSGQGVSEQRDIVSVSVQRGNQAICSGLALNEAVIAQGGIARLVELAARINGEPITEYHADGLIIATPTGSTAYSLAAGGPIVHPGLAAIIVTPINPHSFSQKPIVIRGDSTVEVTVDTERSNYDDTRVYLTLDGQSSYELQSGDVLLARLSDTPITFLRSDQDTFFDTIRRKLRWGERHH